MIKENLLRKKVNNCELATSTRIWSTNPYIIEIIGNSGNFDYVEFAAEYAAFSQIDLENMCRAAELYNMGSMIKIDFQNRGYIAQKAIAAGFQGVLFTDHETPEQVYESVRLTTPTTPDWKGLYGFPMRRYIGGESHLNPMAHAARIKDIVRCFMIERVSSLDAIDEICSIPGVDMVQFGSGDWSMNQGFDRGDKPELCRKAEEKMIIAAQKHNVRVRCEVKCASDAKYYKELGILDYSLDDEVYALRRFWNDEGKEFRRIVKEER